MTGQHEGNIDQEPAGRAMRADARRNYGRLVDAARAVFASQGGGASMEAIAKQAGVGVGTLYRHFPRRIDVVEAVYRGRRGPAGLLGRPWCRPAEPLGCSRGLAAGLR